MHTNFVSYMGTSFIDSSLPISKPQADATMTQAANGTRIPYPQPFQPMPVYSSSTQKQREFRRLNDLELAGVRAEIEVCQKKFNQDHAPQTLVKLLEFQMKELQHCYQLKRDSIQEKDEQISSLKEKLEETKEERNSVLKLKRRREEDFQDLERMHRAKIRKLEDTSKQLLTAEEKAQITEQKFEAKEREYKVLAEKFMSLFAVHKMTLEAHKANLKKLEEQREQIKDLEARHRSEEQLRQSLQTENGEIQECLDAKEQECIQLKLDKEVLESKCEIAHQVNLKFKKALLSIQKNQQSQLQQVVEALGIKEENAA